MSTLKHVGLHLAVVLALGVPACSGDDGSTGGTGGTATGSTGGSGTATGTGTATAGSTSRGTTAGSASAGSGSTGSTGTTGTADTGTAGTADTGTAGSGGATGTTGGVDCQALDVEACATEPACEVLHGRPYQKAGMDWCLGPEEPLGCHPASEPCIEVETPACEDGGGDPYLFPNGCLPFGWSECPPPADFPPAC